MWRRASSTKWSKACPRKPRRSTSARDGKTSSDMGPLVSEEQLNRVCGFLESGRSEGAKAVVGGERHGDKGYFVKPTVLVDTNENMKVVREEIFGPVVSAIPFTDYDDVVRQANNTRVRIGGRNLDARYREGASPGFATARRDGVDQLLQRVRRRSALWRLQAIRMGPRNGPRCAGAVHRSEVGLHRAVDEMADRAGPAAKRVEQAFRPALNRSSLRAASAAELLQQLKPPLPTLIAAAKSAAPPTTEFKLSYREVPSPYVPTRARVMFNFLLI